MVLFDWPAIHTNPFRLNDTAVGHLVVPPAERLQILDTDEEELDAIALVLDSMVYNLGRVDATLG
jgi:hypothetical protein